MPISWTKLLLIALAAVALGALGGFIYWNLSDLPEIKSLESYKPIESSFVYSSDGKVLAEFYLERRNFVPHFRIPQLVKNAFVAVEDQRFYSHPGVDILGMLRALYKDIIAKSIVEGGSTITQQLTKMLFLKPEKSVGRKLKEIILAVQIEKHYTKDEILGMYLNQAYFGTRAYGIAAAAQTYFGKNVSDLAVHEAALLAGLQKAPTQYSPFKSPERSLSRRQHVLRKMLEMGFITKDQYETAFATPLPEKPFYRKYAAPYFIEYLRQQLEARYGDRLYTSGLRIYSTIDSELQLFAEDAVLRGVQDIHKRVRPRVQAALIAIDPKNGHIKAMVGGTDYWETQFNRAVMALRQPGSAFKPFVYVTALQKGMDVEDEILDEPVAFPGGRPGEIWSPKNYDNKYHGYITLQKAIANSFNAATVRLADKVGIKDVAELARKCGVKSALQPYLSLALGSADVTPLELTAAYSVFSIGRRVEPVTYVKVVDRSGVTIEENFPSSEEVLSAELVEKARALLGAVVEMGTAQKAKSIGRKVYGKTGTTNDFSDAWFIGFDDSLVTGVWVGRDDHTPIGKKEAGAAAALPIWIDFMKNAPLDYQAGMGDNASAGQPATKRN